MNLNRPKLRILLLKEQVKFGDFQKRGLRFLPESMAQWKMAEYLKVTMNIGGSYFSP